MPHLRLHLFGFPHLERDGEPVHVGRRKALALFAYIAVTASKSDTKVSRDTLAALFWSEYDQTRARTDLRRMLSFLNKILGRGILVVERETVGLCQDADLWLDVAEFRLLIATARQHDHAPNDICQDCLPLFENALALYQDDFLTGFTLRDSPEFDDWQYLEGEGLRQGLLFAFERLVQGYTRDKLFHQAIAIAQQWLAFDPIHEPAHRSLMHLYALTDQGTAALRQYELCVQVLEEELGVPPEQSTQQLHRDIQENRISHFVSDKQQKQRATAAKEVQEVGLEITEPRQFTEQPTDEIISDRVLGPRQEIILPDISIPGGRIRTATVICVGLARFPDDDVDANDSLDTVNQRITDFQQTVQDVLEHHNAHVIRFLEHTILALFGIEQMGETDAQRAIEAAFNIQNVVQTAGYEASIAINTGILYLSQDAAHSIAELSVSGPVVNLVQRLQSQSKGGQIVVGHNTHRRTQDLFEYTPFRAEIRGRRGKAHPIYLVKQPAPSMGKSQQSLFSVLVRRVTALIPAEVRHQFWARTRSEITFWIFLALILSILSISLILQILNNSMLTQIFIATTLFAIGIITLDFLGIIGEDEGRELVSGIGMNESDAASIDLDSSDVDNTNAHANPLLLRGAKSLLSALVYLRTLVYFCLGFGPTGWVGIMTGRSALSSLFIAISVGAITTFIARIFFNFQRNNVDSSLKREDLLFQYATVTIPLTHKTMGKVRVQVGQSVSDLYALGLSEFDHFEKGDIVQISQVTDEHVYVE